MARNCATVSFSDVPRYDPVLSLARQWTREDEEEVEREKRRRVKTSSISADPDGDFSQTPTDMPSSDSAFGTDSTSETSQGLSRLFPRFSKAEFNALAKA